MTLDNLVGAAARLNPASRGLEREVHMTPPAQAVAPLLASLPLHLWIYTNYDCNLACSYCVVRSSPTAERRGIDMPVYQRLIDEAVDLGVSHVFLTGGEPFLLPDIFERIAYAGERLPTTVLTNAMILPIGSRPQKLAQLDRERISLQVTIDGHDPASHDPFRGRGSWEKAVRGVRLLQDLGFTVYIGSTETSANTGKLDELRRFVASLGIPPERHHIRPLARRGLSEEGVDLSAENLIPELTVNRDGVYWHPFGTEEDLLLTREIFPLRNAYQLLWERYAATVEGGYILNRYHCGVV